MPRDILIDPQRLGTGKPNIQFSGSLDNQVKLEVADLGDLNFKNDVNGNSIFFISGSGNIGIGTTLLDSKLVVAGNLVISGTSNPDADNTRDLGSSTKRWRSLYASNISGSLTGSNLIANQILVAGTGGVVSGTNVFTYDGNLTISGTLRSVYSAGDEGGEIFFTKPQTNTSINSGVTIDMYQNKIRIFEAGGTNRGGYFDISTLGAGVSTNLVGGGGSSTNYWFESAANTIYTTGSAGVGTTSYTSRFYVSGSSTPSTPTMIVREGVATPTGGVGLFDVQNSAGSSLFFVSGSGNIGIGTNVPTSYISTNSTVLAIAHTGNLATVRVSSGPGLGSGNQAEFFAGASSIGIWGTTNVPMLFYTNATEKLRITAGGDVGIGTTSYTARFYVSGSSTSSTPTVVVREGVASPTGGAGTFDVQNSAGTSILFVTGSGRVGIGTITPQATFHVSNGTSPNLAQIYIGYAGSNNYYDANNHYFRDGGANSKARLDSSGNFTPATDNAQDLGSTALRWRNVYATSVSGSLTGSNVLAGQVVVAGTGGVLSGSNNFWWDNTNGRVGIGTNTPASRLDVNDTSNYTRLQIGSAYTYNTYWADYHLFKNNTLVGSTIVSINNNGLIPGTTNSYDIGSTSLIWRNIYAANISGSLTGSNVLAGQVVVAGTGGVLSGTNNLYWNNTNSYLGIGTSSPIGRLSVGNGNQSVVVDSTGTGGVGSIQSYNGALRINNGGNNTILNTDGGVVGIGTTSPPASKFFVSGSVTLSDPVVIIKAGVSSPTGGASVLDVQNSAGTSLLFVSGSGAVGIGTTVSQLPSHKLHVSGKIGGGLYVDSSLEFLATGNTELKANSDLKLGYALSTVIRSTGNVGIGTATPSSRLHVYGSSTSTTSTAIIQEGTTPTGGAAALDVQNVAGTTLFFVSGSGRVGIASSSPNARLEINLGGSNAEILALKTTYAADNSYHSMTWRDGSNITGQIDTRYDGTNVDMVFGSLYSGGYNSTERLRIKGNGNVGIGTSLIDSRLVVNGNSVFSGSVSPDTDATRDLGTASKRWRTLYASNISGSITGSNLTAGQIVVTGAGGILSGTNDLFWDNTNKFVGIGTATPTQALHVRGSTGSDVIALVKNDGAGRAVINLDSGGSSDSNVRFLSQGVNKWSILSSPADLGFYNYTLSSYAMFIAGSTGNVGVNTTTSTAKFTISGSSTASTPTVVIREGVASPTGGVGTFDVQNSAGTSLLFVSGSGNVGIGTTSINEKLVVQGNLGVVGELRLRQAGTSYITVANTTDVLQLGGQETTGTSNARVRIKSTFFEINATNVGIGTTTTSDMLAVNGSMSVTGSLLPGSDGSYTLGSSSKRWSEVRGVNIYGQFFPTSGTPGSVLYVNSSGLAAQDNSNFFWNDSTKQLGIGTASPATKLSVYSGAVSANYGVFSGSLAAYASSTGALYTYWNTTSNYGTIVSVADNSGNAAPMQLRVGGTLSTHIDTTGNVGIGTTSPYGAKLAVYGGTLPSGGSGASNLSFATNLSAGRLASGGGGADVSVINTYFDSSTIEISAGTSSGFVSGITIGARSSPANDSVSLYTRSAERVRIYGASSLMSVSASIEPGTDNTYDLGSSSKKWRTLYATSVSGSITGSNVSAGQVVVAGTGGVLSGSNLLFWDNTNSRLGIGTSSPVVNFNVKGTDTFIAMIAGSTYGAKFTSAGGTGMRIDSTDPTGVSSYQPIIVGGTTITLNANANSTSSPSLYIDTNQNVGIGSTTTLASRLLVSGSATASTPTMIVREGVASPTGGALAFEVENSAGTTILAVSGSGRVGIATTPSATITNAKLEVNGSVVPTTHLGSGNNLGESSNYWGTLYTSTGYFYNAGVNSVAIVGQTFQVYSQTSPTAYSLYADANNRVGIGAIANSSVRLFVSGTSTTTDTTLLVKHGTANGSALAVINAQNSSGTSLLFLSGSGAVGIGTSTLVASGLTVSDVANINNPARLNLRQDNSDVGNRLATVSFNSNAVSIYTAAESTGIANNTLAFFHYNYSIFYTGTTATNPSERLRIDSGGNVGIGTTNPNGNRLAISGGNLSVTGSVLPGVDNTYDLGSSSYRWKQVNMVSGSMVSGSISSLTYTPISTGGSYTRNYLAGESGRLTATKSIAAATNTTFFTITANNGATLVDVSFVVSESGFSVSRKYTVASQYGNTSANVVSFKTVDTGPYGGYDLTVTFTKSSHAVTTCTVSHNYTTTTNIAMTLDVSAVSSGGSPTTVTIF